MARVPAYPDPNLAGSGTDSFPEKLVKYVPAEALAFYVPILQVNGVKSSSSALLLVTAAGLVGAIIYLVLASNRLPVSRRPKMWFYALAGLAFIAWALATVPELGAIFGLSTVISAVILPIAVFLIPAIDTALTGSAPSE